MVKLKFIICPVILHQEGRIMNLTAHGITAVILVMIGLDVNQATPKARIPSSFGTNEIGVSNCLLYFCIRFK